jgi:rRNA maturation protein Rpf1
VFVAGEAVPDIAVGQRRWCSHASNIAARSERLVFQVLHQAPILVRYCLCGAKLVIMQIQNSARATRPPGPHDLSNASTVTCDVENVARAVLDYAPFVQVANIDRKLISRRALQRTLIKSAVTERVFCAPIAYTRREKE